MKYSDSFSRAIQTDDIGHIRSYYRFFRKPTETEFLMALIHNAHQCIEYLTPKFFRAHSTLSFDLMQIAAQSNRVDVLRYAAQLKDWNIHLPSWGLGAPHCGREAAHFLLDQWQGSTSAWVQKWKPNTSPIEHPIFPQREDGPFTLARLSEDTELFERLADICQTRMDVRNLLQKQLLETTRTHYSYCNFDAIFSQNSSQVFFDNEQFCLKILMKSLNSTFPSTLSDILVQPQIKMVAIHHINDLCDTFFSDADMWRTEDFVWANAKALLEIASQIFLQKWSRFYFEDCHTSLMVSAFHQRIIQDIPDAFEALIDSEPPNYVWNTQSVVGSYVIRNKLKKSLGAPQAISLKRKM